MALRLLIAAGESASGPDTLPSGIRDEARGTVGADDPLLALEDAVSAFAPNHLLIALRAGDRAGWQERGLLDRVQERLTLPMTVFSLPQG
jgi:hypothetical protein